MKYLIAGLGNIGVEYQNTRHNIGFDVVDRLAENFDASFTVKRLAHIADFRYKSRSFYLIKPTTFMNKSGKAVKYWLHTLELDLSGLLVVVDDIALPFGNVRIRGKGADGGHNGLFSISEALESDQFPRLRFGIGDDFYRGDQVDYVLSEWSDVEQNELPAKIDHTVDAIKNFGTIGLERTMNQFNTQ